MYKIVSSIGLTEQQWQDGNRQQATARYSLDRSKVILEFYGEEPASLQGVGTNYTLAEIQSVLQTNEWTSEDGIE